jgi:hypothetical protein
LKFEFDNLHHVSRARCGILHAASQNRDPGYFFCNRDPGSAAHRSAKSYALRCVRGKREFVATTRIKTQQ